LKPGLLTLFLLLGTAWAGSFITDEEYGAMLYKNPRGIGCNACHGREGGGKIISRYREGNQTIILQGPAIRGYSAEIIQEGVNRHPRFVPVYHLTPGEYHSLARFLAHHE